MKITKFNCILILLLITVLGYSQVTQVSTTQLNGTISGGSNSTVTVKTTSSTQLSQDDVVELSSASPLTYTLITATSGKRIVVKNTSAVNCFVTGNINESTKTITLFPKESVELIGNSGNSTWYLERGVKLRIVSIPTSGVNIPTLTLTEINGTWADDIDNFGAFSNGAFTVPVGMGGWYEVYFNLHLANNSSTHIYATIGLNGANTSYRGVALLGGVSTDSYGSYVHKHIYLNDGDVLKVYGYHNGGTLKVVSGTNSPTQSQSTLTILKL